MPAHTPSPLAIGGRRRRSSGRVPAAGAASATERLGIGRQVRHPLRDGVEGLVGELHAAGRLTGFVGVEEPDHLVVGVALGVEQSLPDRERLVAVVHVEDVLEVVAHVDDGDLARQPAAEHQTGVVGPLDGREVALAARGGGLPPSGDRCWLRTTTGRRGSSRWRARRTWSGVIRARPRSARSTPDEGEALLDHVLRLLPGADPGVDVEELLGRDAPVRDRTQAVLDADVVPRHASEAGRRIATVDLATSSQWVRSIVSRASAGSRSQFASLP
jgi:hypothetical protein